MKKIQLYFFSVLIVVIGIINIHYDTMGNDTGIVLKTDMTGKKNENAPAKDLSYIIYEALGKADGNLTQASRILGITRQTLYRRMEKYHIR